MSKPLIIIADTDELYLTNLERKFLEEFDDQIDLEIISDADYFEKRFETPLSVEILVVSEKLYSSSLQKHNISNVCGIRICLIDVEWNLKIYQDGHWWKSIVHYMKCKYFWLLKVKKKLNVLML